MKTASRVELSLRNLPALDLVACFVPVERPHGWGLLPILRERQEPGRQRLCVETYVRRYGAMIQVSVRSPSATELVRQSDPSYLPRGELILAVRLYVFW